MWIYLSKIYSKLNKMFVIGRYPHFDGYSENYSPYDSSPFQTVPGSVCESGWGEMGGSGSHLHHPAFLHSREPLPMPPPSNESKALLQAAGYSGQDQIGKTLLPCNLDLLIYKALLFQNILFYRKKKPIL